MSDVPVDEAITVIEEATARLRTTVDAAGDASLAEPSVLPGWARSQVVAHVALNALALVRVYDGLASGEDRTMYDSNAARDADIDEWAVLPADVLRARFADALDAWPRAARAVPVDAWATQVLREPGGRAMTGSETLIARRREVEIHHADLGLAFRATDWPADFCIALLDEAVEERADGVAFTAAPTDLDRTWAIGSAGPGPTVSGRAGDLAFWLVGRGDGAELVSDAGVLPTIGAWR